MNLLTTGTAVLLTATSLLRTSAFQTPSPQMIHQRHQHTKHRPLRQSSEALAEMSPERKSNLFRILLRDLEIEGVPLLSCDANQVHTLNAALWTTMAELSSDPKSTRVCLVLEEIPLSALLAFAEDFTVLKTQGRLMGYLPELRRFSISLVGKGAGPAVLIETDEDDAGAERSAAEGRYEKDKIVAALKSFISRVVVGMEACPYTKNADVSAVGLERQGVTPGPVGYRFSGTTDACQVMAVFWNCICELLAEPEEKLSSIMLSLPGIGDEGEDGGHERFAAVVELVGRYLCLFRGDGAFGLVHFYPTYAREKIHPIDSPAYGHLPPMSWLRPMMKMAGHEADAEQLSYEDLSLANYQRRAPHTAINILRMSQVNAAAGPKSIVDLDLGNGRTEKASGVPLYTRNTLRMVKMGKDALQAELEKEIASQK